MDVANIADWQKSKNNAVEFAKRNARLIAVICLGLLALYLSSRERKSGNVVKLKTRIIERPVIREVVKYKKRKEKKVARRDPNDVIEPKVETKKDDEVEPKADDSNKADDSADDTEAK